MALMILGEDTGHAGVVGGLVRRTLLEVAAEAGAHWFIENIETTLRWVGEIDLDDVLTGLRYTKLKEAAKHGREMRVGGRPVKLRGRLSGAEHQAWRYRLIWALSEISDEPIDALVIARDTDGDPSLREGLDRAIEFHRGAGERRPILVAMPHQDLEGWLVLGFEPEDPKAKQRLTRLIQTLSFDPTHQPERLTGRPNEAKTDAKRVLNQLLFDREQSKPLKRHELGEAMARCLPSRAQIRRFGGPCGAEPFVTAVEEALAPRLLALRS